MSVTPDPGGELSVPSRVSREDVELGTPDSILAIFIV